MATRQPSRRSLLKGAGLLALSTPLPKALADRLSNGFPGLTQATLVPADKGLDPKWVKSLFERGKPTVYTGDELKWIGMPIGGICCGQVYLGGDGRLWYWDMYAPGTSPKFNSAGAGHYERPMEPFAVEGVVFAPWGAMPAATGEPVKTIRMGARPPFASVVRSFSGVESGGDNRNIGKSLELTQESWTPLIPLSASDSSWPLICLKCTIKNKGDHKDAAVLALALPNSIGQYTVPEIEIERHNVREEVPGLVITNLIAKAPKHASVANERPPVVFDDFEDGTYGKWRVEGTAFGDRPYRADELPERLQALKPSGKWLVNSHEARHGEDSPASDRLLGKLTSVEFTIERPYIAFLIGGGAHAVKTCMNLVVGGKVVRTATGRNQVRFDAANWDVQEFVGKKAHLEIVDSESGGWGHVAVDRIEFRDSPLATINDITVMPDFGTMAVAVIGADNEQNVFPEERQAWAPKGPPNRPFGEVAVACQLTPGQSKSFEFVLAWHMPNFGPHPGELASITDIAKQKKHYAKRFKDAADVVRQFAKRKDELYEKTKLWVDTWYDSTLPYWFLERVYIPLNTLQTSTAWWLDSGRFYAFEGVECCAGTCQHVWNYAQSVARIFPELERDTRERVDYGIAFREDGALDYRAEAHKIIAHDGQCGTIIRTYREHTMCPDDAFLRRIWPKVKKSIERMIQEDPNRDGVLEGWQYNTLDAAWKGKISWISSLYAAALQVGALMADEMSDPAFAKECRAIVAKAKEEIPKQLFNGEYFQMERDASAPQSVGYGPGCHVDQVLGDSFLWQIGVPGVLPRDKVKTALKSLYKYNFAPDAGSYRNAMQAVIKGGRWYAMPGEPGLLMTTFPKGGAEVASGKGADTWSAGYFNECMHGFEYQAAAHMFAEGLLEDGMTVIRSIHDRYSAKKRNPFNEIECGDHYARSMASYGAFLTLCGFSYHGPRGRIGFAPKLKPEKFKAPFTSAEGWGTYEQSRSSASLKASYAIKFGRLRVRELTFEVAARHKVKLAKVSRGKYSFGSKIVQNGQSVALVLEGPVQVDAGERLEVTLA